MSANLIARPASTQDRRTGFGSTRPIAVDVANGQRTYLLTLEEARTLRDSLIRQIDYAADNMIDVSDER